MIFNNMPKRVKRRGTTLRGVSGVLAAAVLLGGVALPGDVDTTAGERQAQAAYALQTGAAQYYDNYLVVGGRGYARFNGCLPLTEAMYVRALNAFAAALPDDVKLYSVLAPTSAAVTLPDEYTDQFPDQTQIIADVAAALDERFTSINILPAILAHSDEYLYFNTDHHWTARAGYLAYTEICRALGLAAVPQDEYHLVDSGVAFLGSIAQSTGSAQLARGLDELFYYQPDAPISYTYWDNTGRQHQSQGVYKSWYLRDGQTNKYAFFMGGDLPYIKLTTGAGTGRRLALVKDSYANTVIPFLAAHYDEIHVIDPRNSNFNAVDIITNNNIDDVLFLNYTRVVCLPKFSARLAALIDRDGVAPQPGQAD